MAAPYKPKDVITDKPVSPPPVSSEWATDAVPREPTDSEIADFLKRRAMNMTDEEVEAANIAHQRRLVMAEMEGRRNATVGLTPRPKEQLVVIRLTHDYWPSPQQVVDNPQVPSDLAILPPPYEDKVGVAIIGEARFKAGAVLYLDMDTALTLLSDQKAVRADPLRTVAGNA
jgi:hypothetical protein